MRKLFFFLLSFSAFFATAQVPENLSASEIHQKIKELNFLGTVLYVGAHPDDENTQLISYFSNEENARTAYLSLTRGDGGQNLIGSEIGKQLGVIRTQELLAARAIDGGEQFFTRARDFGYSKTPEETLKIWDKDEVLSDVVWIIRKFKPDLIINRFDHRTPGTTHGHHTSSAILSYEAFEKAGDSESFPEHLQFTETHKPKRLFFNTSPWFYGSREAFEEADKGQFLKINTGVYFPSMGISNPEIAALSRSQHQSQGFGTTANRGQQADYLELIRGEKPQDRQDPFQGINTSWSRLEGGNKIGEILDHVEENFNFRKPSQSIPQLLQAYRLIQNLEDKHWREQKTEEIKEIIAACAGLFLEAVAAEATATPREEIRVNLEAINRSDQSVTLTKVELEPNNNKLQPNFSLKNNEKWDKDLQLKIPEKTEHTSPYWLKNEGSFGMYEVDSLQLIGLPETPRQLKATFTVLFEDIEIDYEKDIVYKYNDPVSGETYQAFDIIPPVSAEIEQDVMIFNGQNKREVAVKLIAGRNNTEGTLRMDVGKGWNIQPDSAEFRIQQKGNSATINFTITSPTEQSETTLTPVATVKDREYSEKIQQIQYPHIPLQTLVLPLGTRLAKLNISKKGENIGYIEGAGDVVPESLEQIGYTVTKLDPAAISAASLEIFDAVVIGVRAYNTIEELKYRQNELLEYVKEGGTLIVQYNTSRGIITDNISPYDLELSSNRVSEEDAEVRFLAKDHPVLNTPNKITQEDFDGWVQERGLYFPGNWAQEFTPVLSMNDTGESPKEGSLLVAKYGKGHYIYTGLSFFRQFPSGVPGAYRLFANLISIGK